MQNRVRHRNICLNPSAMGILHYNSETTYGVYDALHLKTTGAFNTIDPKVKGGVEITLTFLWVAACSLALSSLECSTGSGCCVLSASVTPRA